MGIEPGHGESVLIRIRCGGRSRAGVLAARLLFRPKSRRNLVGTSIAFRQKPEPATLAVIPPLDLTAVQILSKIEIPRPLGGVGADRGARMVLTSKIELVDRTTAA